MRVVFCFLLLVLVTSCGKSEQKSSVVEDFGESTISKEEAIKNVRYQATNFTRIGEPSCGAWVKGIEESATENSVSAAELSNLSWLMGYVSGRNSLSHLDVLENTDGESILLYITNYCKERPLDSLAAPANTLFLELMNKNTPN